MAWAGRLSTWGEVTEWPVAANDADKLSCNLRFAGQYADEESGLHYNRFRYYDNGTGQYLSPDPIGLSGGVNPYGYVHNPLGWVDPLGLSVLALPAPTSLNPWGSGASLESALTPKGGITVEMAMSPGQTSPGGWSTVDHIPDVNYVRNQLAVIPGFKPEISHVQQFHIPEGIRIQTGPVGPQIYGGVRYPGGGSQIQILNYADRARLSPTGEPRKIYSNKCGC